MMASSDAPRVDPAVTGGWEGEGGSIASQGPDGLPDGVAAISVTHYRVGEYLYTNRNDALAEHRRQHSK
jgi:hypothetical protein